MRARITATVAVLVALALLGTGLTVYAVESRRLLDDHTAAVEQELAEFATLQDGVDPATGRPFTSPRRMVRLFLERNVPDADELLVAWWDGEPRFRSPSNELTAEPVFRDAVRSAIADDSGYATLDVPGYGELMVTVQNVADERGDAAALVVVTFLDETRAGLASTMRTYALVALLALVAITAIAFWQSGRLLAPLRTLRETTDEITETDLARRLPERGNDDITALTRTVNGMLARLEAAFAGQRQFVDDVGHELKTPLTVLRGHLELLDHDDPREVAETRALLLDEIDRMSRLVEDLILLAKSGRPDFLVPRPVRVDELTPTLLAKARGLGDRQWVLDNVAERIAALLDEQRITQAVLQLADNAVKHTRDGDEIGIGSAYDASGLQLWVRDSGNGVPEPDRERIFERFGRGRVPAGDEGFGLGLSIVRAIAEAHHGEVRVADAGEDHRPGAPRSGAWFVITLPGGSAWQES